MSKLFSQFSIGELTLANRIVIAPMCQYSASNGNATDWHTIHLGHLALSGAGLLILEATAVSDVGRISYADLGLWSDQNEESLSKVLASVRRYSNMPIGIQLSHAGRKASTEIPWKGKHSISVEQGGWETVAPSPIPFSPSDTPPRELTQSDMDAIIAEFVEAARRANRVGIDSIEVHAAHGYLLHQFLSPLSNKRQDMYGGSLENRMQFPLEVFVAIRNTFPANKPVGVRISATDWVDGGWTLEDSIVFSLALRELGCAYIHVSSGGLSPLQSIVSGRGYQVGFAEQIKRVIEDTDSNQMAVIAVGLITDAEQAEAILAEGKADLVAIARGMLYDPRWPWHAAAKLGASVNAPPQYWRCQPAELKELFKTDG